MKLAKEAGRCQEVNIYNSALEILALSESGLETETFIINETYVPALTRVVEKAKSLSSQLGLSRFEYLQSEIGVVGFTKIFSLIRKSGSAIKVRDELETWFIYEDSNNPLIECCEKIFSLTNQLDREVLLETLRGTLRRNLDKYELPNELSLIHI